MRYGPAQKDEAHSGGNARWLVGQWCPSANRLLPNPYWLEKYNWDTLPHPPHKPHLALYDFLMFDLLKRHLARKCCVDDGELKVIGLECSRNFLYGV
ncbi:mariner Mos1 transposase [Elysia marginata]|uniref:Mariner Mos1 transposase n=1 Tax=Elysia marginata TaxID=1093978 RepID=A0AAV4EXY7_9GAST|nr:mariner Mos1 transposase [Elysia marginata]